MLGFSKVPVFLCHSVCMAPVQNSMDCVTERCLTALSRMRYYDRSGPNKDNYAEYFHNLLYLEEYEAKQKLHQYNMKDVPVKIVTDRRLELEVSVGTSYMSMWNNKHEGCRWCDCH